MNMFSFFKSFFAQNRKFEKPKPVATVPIVLRYAPKKVTRLRRGSMAAPQALECANGAHWVGRGPAVGVVQTKAILVSIQLG